MIQGKKSADMMGGGSTDSHMCVEVSMSSNPEASGQSAGALIGMQEVFTIQPKDHSWPVARKMLLESAPEGFALEEKS